MHEYLRKIGLIHVNHNKYINGFIKHHQFVDENYKIQSEATNFHRMINVNMVFVKEIKEDIDHPYESYFILCDKLYDGFVDPDNSKPIYYSEEVPQEKINETIYQCMNSGELVISNINKKIKKELEKLN